MSMYKTTKAYNLLIMHKKQNILSSTLIAATVSFCNNSHKSGSLHAYHTRYMS